MEKMNENQFEKMKSEILPSDEVEEGELWKAVLASKPRFSSNAEAAAAYRLELDELAVTHGQTVEDLLHEAHTSHIFKDHHFHALALERRIGYLSIKK